MSDTPHSAEPPAGQTASIGLTFSVEKHPDDRYRLYTDPDDLQRIGELLRGKPVFSFFSSIGLPALVTLITIVLGTMVTAGLQYISWTNSERLQRAADQANRANTAYNDAITAINRLHYASLVAIPALQDELARTTSNNSALQATFIKIDDQRITSYYDQLAT
jgi:hypothetical protein